MPTAQCIPTAPPFNLPTSTLDNPTSILDNNPTPPVDIPLNKQDLRISIPVDYNDYCLQKFKAIARQYEIRPDFCQKLRQLEGYEIVLLCDDSGSMSNIVDDNKDPFGRKITRWDELKNSVSIIVEIASTLDKNGLDIYFLNRGPVYNVSSFQQVQTVFQYPPNGYTPLVFALDRIFKEKEMQIKEKKLLLIIATDGQPTDNQGNINIIDFLNKLKNRPKNIFVSIMACTDDEKSIGYLNKIDRDVPGIDTIDDYRSEFKEVQKYNGKNFAFSFGDYIVKALLGPIDPYFDNLDEQNVSGGCCVIS